MPQFTVDIAGIAALILAIIALYKAWKMTPKEAIAVDADTSTKYAQAAGMSADQVAKALERIDKLETKVDALQKELEQRDCLIEEWQMGIEKLITQLKEHNIEPVWKPKPISKQV